MTITSYYGYLDRTAQELCGFCQPGVALLPILRTKLNSGKSRRTSATTPDMLHEIWLYRGWSTWASYGQYYAGWWFQPLWKILVSWDDYSKQPTSIYYHILLYTIYTYSNPELWLNNDLVKYYSIANLKCHTHIHDVRRLQDSYIYIYKYIFIFTIIDLPKPY